MAESLSKIDAAAEKAFADAAGFTTASLVFFSAASAKAFSAAASILLRLSAMGQTSSLLHCTI